VEASKELAIFQASELRMERLDFRGLLRDVCCVRGDLGVAGGQGGGVLGTSSVGGANGVREEPSLGLEGSVLGSELLRQLPEGFVRLFLGFLLHGVKLSE
jgi:hypothetical protein